jgi:hypothetical protein
LAISAFYVTSTLNKPLPPPRLYIYIIYVNFWMKQFILCQHISIFRVELFYVYYLELFVPKVHCNFGTTNAPLSVILFVTLNSHFSTILNLLVYYFSHSLVFVDVF